MEKSVSFIIMSGSNRFIFDHYPHNYRNPEERGNGIDRHGEKFGYYITGKHYIGSYKHAGRNQYPMVGI